MNEKIQKVAGLVATGKFWKEVIIMTLGMMVAAAAVYYFLVPSKLIIGTVSGLSIVLSGIFETFFGIQIKVSLFVVIINAILLVLAWLLIGEEFGAKTVYTAMILGPLMDFWAWVMPYQSLMEPGTTSVMGDIWFDLCCFVLLLSLSQAILFNINASTGGLDILAKIVNKYLHFDIGASVSVAGAMICCTAFAINPFKMVIIGLIGTWINGLVVDYFTASLNKRKRVCVISNEYDRIRRFHHRPAWKRMQPLRGNRRLYRREEHRDTVAPDAGGVLQSDGVPQAGRHQVIRDRRQCERGLRPVAEAQEISFLGACFP